jgi:hypothetical protein
MPTNRKRTRRPLRPELTAAQLEFLLGLPGGRQARAEFTLAGPDRTGPLWREFEAQLLNSWVLDRPGSRPRLWWRHIAPEARRERLGGIGCPIWEAGLAYAPAFTRGVPRHWLAREHLRIWPEITAPPVDPADPPTFEAEATYLRRHGLLLPGERERLSRSGFRPEPVGRILAAA